MKFTRAGAGADAGAVCSVQFAVCCVQCPACHRQQVSTSNHSSLIKLCLRFQAFKKKPQSVKKKYLFDSLKCLNLICVTPSFESTFVMRDMKSL